MHLVTDKNRLVNVNTAIYPKYVNDLQAEIEDTTSIFVSMSGEIEKITYETLKKKDPKLTVDDFRAKAFTEDFKDKSIVRKVLHKAALQGALLVDELSKEHDELCSKLDALNVDEDSSAEAVAEAINQANEFKIQMAKIEYRINCTCRANGIFGAFYNCPTVEDATTFDYVSATMVEKLSLSIDLAGQQFKASVEDRNKKTDAINQAMPDLVKGAMAEVAAEMQGSTDTAFRRTTASESVEQALDQQE